MPTQKKTRLMMVGMGCAVLLVLGVVLYSSRAAVFTSRVVAVDEDADGRAQNYYFTPSNWLHVNATSSVAGDDYCNEFVLADEGSGWDEVGASIRTSGNMDIVHGHDYALNLPHFQLSSGVPIRIKVDYYDSSGNLTDTEYVETKIP